MDCSPGRSLKLRACDVLCVRANENPPRGSVWDIFMLWDVRAALWVPHRYPGWRTFNFAMLFRHTFGYAMPSEKEESGKKGTEEIFNNITRKVVPTRVRLKAMVCIRKEEGVRACCRWGRLCTNARSGCALFSFSPASFISNI